MNNKLFDHDDFGYTVDVGEELIAATGRCKCVNCCAPIGVGDQLASYSEHPPGWGDPPDYCEHDCPHSDSCTVDPGECLHYDDEFSFRAVICPECKELWDLLIELEADGDVDEEHLRQRHLEYTERRSLHAGSTAIRRSDPVDSQCEFEMAVYDTEGDEK